MKYLFYTALLPILLLSCATPAPISQLTATDENNPIWVDGREVLTQRNDSLTVEVSYYEKQNNNFIFDITIVNQKQEAITIDPLNFSYIPISTSGDTLNPVLAVDPEYRILKHQMKISQLDADRKNEIVSTLIFGSIELATDIADDNPQDSYYDEHQPSIFDMHEREIAKIDYNQLNTHERKSYWENQSLRKTTIFSEYYTSGQIFLKYKKNIDKVGLVFSIDDTYFEFWFDHFIIKPYY